MDLSVITLLKYSLPLTAVLIIPAFFQHMDEKQEMKDKEHERIVSKNRQEEDAAKDERVAKRKAYLERRRKLREKIGSTKFKDFDEEQKRYKHDEEMHQ